jgi:hypothetical protein
MEIEDLVGYARGQVVNAYLAQNTKNLEHRVEMLIERARQRLAQHRSGDLPARIAAEWASAKNLTGGLSHSTSETCPACGAEGLLERENVEQSNIRYEQTGEDDYDTWVDLTISAAYFSCPTCRLVLDEYDLLEQAGLSTTFDDVGDTSDYQEQEYGND